MAGGGLSSGAGNWVQNAPQGSVHPSWCQEPRGEAEVAPVPRWGGAQLPLGGVRTRGKGQF